MKYILMIFFCLALFKASAQKTISNVDTVYYLLDTLNIPVKDRMWDIGIESKYKYFSIKCPCLKYDSQPTFVYNINEPGKKYDKNSILKFNTVSLVTLIELTKKSADLMAQTLYIYYLVEKVNDFEYLIHKTRLLTPRKRESSIDYENIPAKEK